MHGSESDVPADAHVARSREGGGLDPDRPDRDDHEAAPDGTGTTGVDRNDGFVGRVAGDDAGDVGESGAERRAEGGVRS